MEHEKMLLLFLFSVLLVQQTDTASIGWIKDDLNIISLITKSFDVTSCQECTCSSFTNCTCCRKITSEKLEALNENFCINMNIALKHLQLTFTAKLNGEQIFQKSLNASTIPPICFSFPQTQALGDICIKLHDKEFRTGNKRLCIDVQPRLAQQVLTSIELGCFDMSVMEKIFNGIETLLRKQNPEEATNLQKLDGFDDISSPLNLSRVLGFHLPKTASRRRASKSSIQIVWTRSKPKSLIPNKTHGLFEILGPELLKAVPLDLPAVAEPELQRINKPELLETVTSELPKRATLESSELAAPWLSDIEAQELPDILDPDLLEITKLELPEISTPGSLDILDPESSKISVPELPGIEAQGLPETVVPDLPETGTRELPEKATLESSELVTPQLSGIEMQELSDTLDPEFPEIGVQELPDIVNSELPANTILELPKITTPESSDILDPESSKIAAPELPGVEAQELPETVAPDLSETEARELPGVEAQELPETVAPDLSETEAREVPEITAQELPKIAAPELLGESNLEYREHKKNQLSTGEQAEERSILTSEHRQ